MKCFKNKSSFIVVLLILLLGTNTALALEQYIYTYDKYSVNTSTEYIIKKTYNGFFHTTTYYSYYPDIAVDPNTGEITPVGNKFHFIINGGDQEGYLIYYNNNGKISTVYYHKTNGKQGNGSTSVQTYTYIINTDTKTNYIKGNYLETISSYTQNYPIDGIHTDGYWYVYKSMQKVNKIPELSVKEPIHNYRISNQDNIFIRGMVKDEDLGDMLFIKYMLGDIQSNIILTQPITIISNSQNQAFEGYIRLDGLSSGNNILKLWAEDNKGGKSDVTEISIVIFNTLENILESLKTFVYKAGEPQILVINSDTTITQSPKNDILIEQIKQELEIKNVKLFFIGKDGATESYINANLLQ